MIDLIFWGIFFGSLFFKWGDFLWEPIFKIKK